MAAAARGRAVSGVDKPWRDAIRLAVHREVGEGQEKQKLLNVLATKLVRCAVEGDISALKEIGDRLDGKPAQAIVGDSAADPINITTKIERIIVNAGNPDSPGIPPAA